MEAAYYDNIMEQQRLEPEFFRVGFYGRKFPFFLRVSSTFQTSYFVTSKVKYSLDAFAINILTVNTNTTLIKTLVLIPQTRTKSLSVAAMTTKG